MNLKDRYSGAKFIYITDPLLETVKDSQVINWIQLLDEENIHFDLLIPTTLYYLIARNRLRKSKIRKAKDKLSGTIIQLPIIKRRDRSGISSILLKSYLIVLVFFYHLKYRRIIVQTRNFNFVKVLRPLRSTYNKTRIIYDMRGAAAEEYINALGYMEPGTIQDQSILKKYHKILLEQKEMIGLADQVLCVSDKLKHYAIRLNPAKDPDEIKTIPGAADKTIFFFEKELGRECRRENRIEDKFVLVYSGKLDRPWHKPEFIFSLASSILKKDPRMFFCCFTPDLKAAESLVLKSEIDRDRLMLKYVENEDLNRYYNGADLGLLIRDDIPTNHVASPTKLPEYLLAGLPVMISKNIGDYSDFVEKHGLGFIVENSIDKITDLFPLDRSSGFDRAQISKKAAAILSKQSKISDLLKLYSKLQ